MIWFLIVVLVIIAVAGGLAISPVLWFVLVLALLAYFFFGRGARV